MTRTFPFFLIALMMLPPLAYGEEAQTPVLESVEHKTLASMTYDLRKTAGEVNPVYITTLTLPPHKFGLRLAIPTTSVDGSSLARFKLDEGAAAALTGGILDTYAPATPAGLVRKGDTVYNVLYPDDKVMDAVLCFSSDKNGRVVITSRQAYMNNPPKGDCVQTGPFLVKDGRKEADLVAIDVSLKFPFSEGLFSRAFLLLNSRNEVIMGVSSRVSLTVLRELLLRPEKEGGFGAVFAVGMPGTRFSGLIIDGNPEITAGSVQTLLPNAIIVERR